MQSLTLDNITNLFDFIIINWIRRTYENFSSAETVESVFAGRHVTFGNQAVLGIHLEVLITDPDVLAIDSLTGSLGRVECKTDAAHLEESTFQFRVLTHAVLQRRQYVPPCVKKKNPKNPPKKLFKLLN